MVPILPIVALVFVLYLRWSFRSKKGLCSHHEVFGGRATGLPFKRNLHVFLEHLVLSTHRKILQPFVFANVEF
jgi:hypothetical protein